MPAQASNLTAAQYGYDFVVATTQSSINSTMLTYLSGLNTATITKCWTRKKATGTVSISERSRNTVEALSKCGFVAGFQITLGIPPGIDPASVPDVVLLGNNTETVTYNMLCSNFQIIGIEYSSDGAEWINKSQPSTGWIFQSKVDLRLDPVPATAYGKLPKDVQAQVKNLGADAFGVQQLLFDLNNAGLSQVPTIPGLEPSSYAATFLTQYFVGTYFAEVQKAGTPVLNYTIVKHDNPATLIPTDLNMAVQPFLDPYGKAYAAPNKEQANMATLSYLCSCYGKRLPPAVPFTWNWVSAQEAQQYHGVVSINRNTFATYLKGQLSTSIPKNCLVPTATVKMTNAGFTKTYSAGVSTGGVAAFTSPATGATVLNLHYEKQADDYAGLNNNEGEIHLKPSFDVTVSFQNDNIVITQASERLAQDTYKLGVDDDGKLVVNRQSDPLVNKSQTPSTDAFTNLFTCVNQIVNKVRTIDFTSTTFQSFPIAVVQDFVFPGGKTFAFKQMAFSDNQDLVAAITSSGQESWDYKDFLLALCPPNIDPSSLSVMVAFAVGGLLGDTLFHLLPEIFLGEAEPNHARFVLVSPNKNLLLGVAIMVGFLTFVAMDKGLRIATGGEGGHDHSHGTASGANNGAATAQASGTDAGATEGALKSRKGGAASGPVVLIEQKEAKEPSQSIKLSAYLNLIADFTHNITDGLAMSSSFYASPTLGATTTVAVFFHEIPHEVGDFALLIQSGFSKRRAMGAQFVTAAGAFLGTCLGIAVQEMGKSSGNVAGGHPNMGLAGTGLSWGDLLLPFTAGTFLYVGTVAVIPELLETGPNKGEELRKTITQFAAMAVGAGIMLAYVPKYFHPCPNF
ncbi:MAG: hypothetical protein LQ344_001882 [Seirophora lacunosa]|nr:MAG: hypothetical protein LQ344_001882 [Seirophora lacunosa]